MARIRNLSTAARFDEILQKNFIVIFLSFHTPIGTIQSVSNPKPIPRITDEIKGLYPSIALSERDYNHFKFGLEGSKKIDLKPYQ